MFWCVQNFAIVSVIFAAAADANHSRAADVADVGHCSSAYMTTGSFGNSFLGHEVWSLASSQQQGF
jgi:hypothetical protein